MENQSKNIKMNSRILKKIDLTEAKELCAKKGFDKKEILTGISWD